MKAVARKKAASGEPLSRRPTRAHTASTNAREATSGFAHDFTRIPVHSASRPLDAATRTVFEPRFARDLSDIRVHADAEADRASRSIDARAFTFGRDIFFRSGGYDPSSAGGRHLLAHELTHSVQQSGGHGDPTRAKIGRIDDPLEHDADKARDIVLRGGVAKPEAGPPVLRRKAAPGPTEREKIEKALKSKDAADVKDINDVTQAGESEKVQLISILVDQGWVGPFDEWKLEELWRSLGDRLTTVVGTYRDLWDLSIAGGAEIAALLDAPRAEKEKLANVTKPGSGKSFSEVGGSLAKQKDLEHDLQVIDKGVGTYEGNKCLTPGPAGTTPSDCTEFVLQILRETFAQLNRQSDWAKVESKYLANRNARFNPKSREKKTLSGIDVQAALQQVLGWKGIFWSPDPSYRIPTAEIAAPGPGEAAEGLRKAKKGTYYKEFGEKGSKGSPGVAISQIVTDYAPETPNVGYGAASKTVKETTQLEKLKKLPFGVMSAHGGFHMAILTNGKVLELHQSAHADSVNVIERVDFERWWVGPASGFHFFASGVIVAPAEDVRKAFE
jgi:hypothetical protein